MTTRLTIPFSNQHLSKKLWAAFQCHRLDSLPKPSRHIFTRRARSILCAHSQRSSCHVKYVYGYVFFLFMVCTFWPFNGLYASVYMICICVLVRCFFFLSFFFVLLICAYFEISCHKIVYTHILFCFPSMDMK